MSFEEENIFEISDDEDVDTPTTTESEDNQEGAEAEAEQTSEAKAEETKEPEDEDKKILDYLNKKGIKYNGETVELTSLDDVVNNIQKGMNYDKMKDKQDHKENVVMTYISEMARKFGMTEEQYIENVKAYEKQKEKEAMENDVQKMVSKGVDEETARRVAKVELAIDQLEREKAELQKQREEMEEKAKEEKELEEFINAYPDVDKSTIPDEVFKESKEIGLRNAYERYENKILREKLKQMELNQKNSSTSVVTSTTDSGSTEQRGKDDFERAIFYEEE